MVSPTMANRARAGRRYLAALSRHSASIKIHSPRLRSAEVPVQPGCPYDCRVGEQAVLLSATPERGASGALSDLVRTGPMDERSRGVRHPTYTAESSA